jgi:hypothetical protein
VSARVGFTQVNAFSLHLRKSGKRPGFGGVGVRIRPTHQAERAVEAATRATGARELIAEQLPEPIGPTGGPSRRIPAHHVA